MDLTRHCELCEHQRISLEQGTTCGLTARKPEFNKTCLDITLKEKFENRIKTVNINYEKVKKSGLVIYIYFIVFIGIGIAIMTGGYLLGKYFFDKGVISAIPLIIIGAGFGPFILAVSTLSKYRQEMNVAKRKKERVDEVLTVYQMEYEIDIKFGKEYHGNQEVVIDLEVISKK